jgi:tRNA(Ile)-lysidine synthetase, N-terminal domain/tRNA(Ile)-lysidine synthetase, C-terminal domain
MSTIADELAAFFRERMPKLSGSRFLVGVSGGADSVALLKLTVLLAEKYAFSVAAVHVNHGLRGKQSDADEAFCVALAKKMQVKIICCHPKVLKGAGLEARAREARYKCFSEVYRDTQADALLTAHHADDQAETLLMHLMRGAGIHGMAGIKAERELYGMRVLRPLLMVPKNDLLALAGDFRLDESNLEDDNLRNALRLKVMPLLNGMAPHTALKMAQTAQLAALEDDFMDGLAAEVTLHEAYVPIEMLKGLHPALSLRVLRRFAGECDFKTAMGLMVLLDAAPGTKVNLEKGRLVQRGYDYLFLPDRLAPITAQVEPHPFDRELGDGKCCQAMQEAMAKAAQWRYWQEGDTIAPFGSAGKMSLQDYFTNQKVDAPFRRMIPLLAEGNTVLWVPGVGASENVRAVAGAEMLFLKCSHEMPWLKEGEY